MGQLYDWTPRVLTRVFSPKSQLFGSGVENARAHLPPLEVTKAKFAALGFTETALRWKNRRGVMVESEPPYPLAWGMSDFFAVRADAMAQFVRYAGVFAALDVFVEVAIPTALIYACADLRLCAEPWHYDWKYTPLGRQADPVIWRDVLAKFDDHMLFVHPVKLSAIPIEEL
jgi:hypothetical protein